MSRESFHRPIIALLLSIIGGILLGNRFPGNALWACGLIVLCAAFLFRALRKNTPSLFPPLLIFASLGALLIQPCISPRFSPHHILHFVNIRHLRIEGVVERIEFRRENRVRWVLQTAAVYRKGRALQTTGRIRVTVFGKNPGISAGDRIAFSGKIRPFRNFNNPGGFDYKRYMAFKKIWGAVYISSEGLTVVKKAGGGGVRRRIEDARLRISGWIEQQTPEPAAGVLKALIVGNRTDIPQQTRSVFHRSGTGHMLAISGLHIGIVATVSFFLFRRLLSFVKPMLWRAWSHKGAAILALIPVWGYGMLAGMSPSTLRAVIMVSIFLSALLLDRDRDSINTLALAAFCILILDPTNLYSISFQLSFAAVFSILLAQDRILSVHQGKTEGLGGRFRKIFIGFVLVSLFAIIGTLPLVMRYFNEVSMVGLLGNLIAIPLIGFVVVPLGLVAVCVYPFSVALAAGFIKTASAALMQAIGLLSVISGLPYAAFKTITPSMVETIGYYAMLLALCCLPKARGSRRKLAGAIVVLSMAVFAVDAAYWIHHRFLHTDLRITAIDVGQGSATLLELPGGKTVLIDGGGFSDNSLFDLGARVIAPLLWRKKIMTVDTMILTHPNSDHLNGLLYIAEHFTVGRIWTNGEPADTRGYADWRRIVAERRIPVPEFQQLVGTHRFGPVEVELLYPPADFMHRKRTEKWRVANNNSLVLKIRYGSVSFLLPGDIMKRAEAELVDKKGEGLGSTVLFAPHHGSLHSSTADFLEKVSPRIVVISSGWRHRAGAPHPSVLERYRDRGCRIFNTVIHGAVALHTDGRALQIMPYIAD